MIILVTEETTVTWMEFSAALDLCHPDAAVFWDRDLGEHRHEILLVTRFTARAARYLKGSCSVQVELVGYYLFWQNKCWIRFRSQLGHYTKQYLTLRKRHSPVLGGYTVIRFNDYSSDEPRPQISELEFFEALVKIHPDASVFWDRDVESIGDVRSVSRFGSTTAELTGSLGQVDLPDCYYKLTKKLVWIRQTYDES